MLPENESTRFIKQVNLWFFSTKMIDRSDDNVINRGRTDFSWWGGNYTANRSLFYTQIWGKTLLFGTAPVQFGSVVLYSVCPADTVDFIFYQYWTGRSSRAHTGGPGRMPRNDKTQTCRYLELSVDVGRWGGFHRTYISSVSCGLIRSFRSQ